MAADLTDTIATNAVAPQSVTIDGQTASQHPIPDQIAADVYAKSQASTAKNHFGLRFVKLEAPGAG